MRGDADQLAVAGAAAHAGDVALGVDLHVLQAERLGHLEPLRRSGFFLERRRRDFGQRDDVGDRALVFRRQRGSGGGEGRVLQDAAYPRFGVLTHPRSDATKAREMQHPWAWPSTSLVGARIIACLSRNPGKSV